MIEIEIGQVWRPALGGCKMQVVGFEDGFVMMLRADWPKKKLAEGRAGYPAAPGEFDRGEWILVE